MQIETINIYVKQNLTENIFCKTNPKIPLNFWVTDINILIFITILAGHTKWKWSQVLETPLTDFSE